MRERLDKLRALVATAARFGVFRIEGEKESRTQRAERLADEIRILKGVDPTLGIYAAYACAEADIIEQVRSVREYLHGDLNTDLFDVAMLAGALSGRVVDGAEALVPFCLVLYQGWGKVRLRREIAEASNLLRPALWTSFDPKGMSIVIKAFN